ncbi:DNA-deoxyinosine glycosylase [Dechloromonas sp. ZY10]|uniref:DNA-deoxyinosine glycosylase n=1 Tax=Dechloromonas aquae TaxID=2664436 RepID=UPI0035279AD0
MRCFAPAVQAGARVLILGSMPGEASLRAGEYYAHPRNAFWMLIDDLLGIERHWPYAQRLAALNAAGVALWDVIAGCRREGSLDAAIVGESVAVNDFAAFFTVHPGIRQIFFNGAAAEHAFRRHLVVRPDWPAAQRLPSTSPAHAALSYAAKRAAWAVLPAALARLSPSP